MKRSICIVLSILLVLFAVCGSVSAQDGLPFSESAFYQVGDYSLHYRVFPSATQKKGDILFIHGFGLSTAAFEELIPYFTQNGYACVAVDVPNMGYSTRETLKTELVERERLIYALMSYLQLDKCILCGHSMGGGIALNLAVEHEERIQALLLLNPQTSPQLSRPLARLTKSFLVRKLFDTVISLGCGSDFIMNVVGKAAFQDDGFFARYDMKKINQPLRIRGTGEGMAIMASHAKGTDFEKVKQLMLPALLIEGDIDNVARQENLTMITDALQNAEVCVFKNAGHMLLCTRAQQVAELSLDFLNRMEGN